MRVRCYSTRVSVTIVCSCVGHSNTHRVAGLRHRLLLRQRLFSLALSALPLPSSLGYSLLGEKFNLTQKPSHTSAQRSGAAWIRTGGRGS